MGVIKHRHISQLIVAIAVCATVGAATGPLAAPALAVAPTVHTEAASEIGQTSATVNATVNPNGEEVKECWFEYGTSIPYEAKMPCVQHPGSGTGPVTVTAVLQGLSANTTYHFRIVAVSGGGRSEGADSQFMTLAAPPAVPSEPASGTGYPAAAASPPATGNPAPPVETLVRAPLLAHISTHVLKGRILELRFHLSVKARVRLLAKRERRVVARTRWRTLAAGDCKLLLRLNVQRWPKRLVLQTRALGPLPLIASKERVALG